MYQTTYQVQVLLVHNHDISDAGLILAPEVGIHLAVHVVLFSMNSVAMFAAYKWLCYIDISMQACCAVYGGHGYGVHNKPGPDGLVIGIIWRCEAYLDLQVQIRAEG